MFVSASVVRVSPCRVPMCGEAESHAETAELKPPLAMAKQIAALAASRQAAACLYLMMWGIGCEAQWLVEKLNAEHVLRNTREKSRLKWDHR